MSVKNAVHKTSGYAAAAALSALLVKYPLRKLGMHKANAALMQAHEAASGAYFLAALLHMATSPKTSGCKGRKRCCRICRQRRAHRRLPTWQRIRPRKCSAIVSIPRLWPLPPPSMAFFSSALLRL